MDKLKPIGKVIKKYHVWVLCLVVVGTAVGGLFAASGSLESQAKKTKVEIDGLKTQSEGLKNQKTPYNQKWLDAKDKEIETERARNRGIWERIYERQQRKLVWPEKLGGLEFASQIDVQRAEARLIKEHEDAFEKYASEVFDDLLKVVKAEANYSARAPVAEKDARTGEPKNKAKPTTLAPVRPPYVVGWLAASQIRIRDPLINWGDENRFGRPSKTRVLATQRKLWIYNSLLSAISKTNGKAEANYMAKVKHILDLQVGKDVKSLHATPAARARQPGSNFRGIEPVPARMDVIVDQRHLSALLAELANAPIPVEISGFVATYESKRQGEENRRDPRKGQNTNKGPVPTIVDSYDMKVSIEGKVNFFKKPDENLLGVSKAAP